MNIDHSHPGSSFTKREMEALFRGDRFYVATSEARRINPGAFYFVLVRPFEGEFALEAWPVDAAGVKISGPVVLQRELALQHPDTAPDDVRKRLAELVGRGGQIMKTYVFATAKNPHAIAIGDGHDVVTAMEVASRSLLRRFPQIAESPSHKDLLESLGSHEVTVKFETTSRDFAGRWKSEAMSGYASSDTHLLAQALTSDRVAVEVLAALPSNASVKAKASALRCEDRLSRCFSTSDGRIDMRWVDWVEVVDSFDEEVELERGSLHPKPTPALNVEESANADSLASFVAPSAKGRSIDRDVLDVLATCEVDGLLVRLPPVQLEKRLYSRVNDVLVALGGKWTGGKTMAHKFKESPEAQLALAVSTGTYVKPQDFGFFPTQPKEVDLVIKEARLEPGMLVGEPSAGTGAIALKAAEVVGMDNVHLFELLKSNVAVLREAGFSNVHQGDFLAVEPVQKFDVIVMNPPFGGGADVEHVQHAARFLKPTGRLVAITSKAFEHNTAKKFEAFRDFVEESAGVVRPIEAGAFRAVGTNIETRVITFEAKNFPWNWEIEEPARMRG